MSKFDEAKRIRVDDWELSPEVQTEVLRRWPLLSTETLGELADLRNTGANSFACSGSASTASITHKDVDPRVVT